MSRTIAMRVRAAWRRCFAPEPPIRLDGVWIQVSTRMRPEGWSQAGWFLERDKRGADNRERFQAWKRGELVND
jgi:hypothetical protein